MRLSEIHIRDPFVLPVTTEGRYYLYGTMGEYTWKDFGIGFDCYSSVDLQNWDGPFPAFRPSDNFWADQSFWAPEVYAYGGKYYMFASFKAKEIRRGTQILMAESPLGPFHPLGASPVTPPEWECLDGTLFVSQSGDPWMVFSHEWVQVGDGEICALPLTKDLTAVAGEPILLFSASQASWCQQINSKGRKGYVTDGPWLHRLSDGELFLLWSSFHLGKYAIGMARSASGQIYGPWIHKSQPLYSDNGGHCMTFKDFEGNCWLSLHSPDNFPNERPVFLPLEDNKLELKPSSHPDILED